MMNFNLMGEIRLFAGEHPPSGWAFCRGQTLKTADQYPLSTIIGNRFGGDGTTNFQLPNLAPVKESDGGKTPVQYAICFQGKYPSQFSGDWEETGFLGQVRLFAGDLEPYGWKRCQGQMCRDGLVAALYVVIGKQYGGVENAYVNLPKMAPLKESDGGAAGIGYIINVGGSFPSRA